MFWLHSQKMHFVGSNSQVYYDNLHTGPAMSNPNGLLSQKSCRYLNQGRTFYNRLTTAANWMAYFDLIKLI